jgi:xanthine dehydrogenase accessory factor
MIYADLLAALHQGAVVVATVISIKGSVPREVGAKMLITQERCFDTIGGGAGEAKVIHYAREVLQTGQKQCIEIDLTGSPHRQTEGICGGWMQILLERWQGESAIALVNQILSELRLGRSLTLVTPYSENPPYLSPEPIADEDAFSEILEPDPILLIVGAGHVGEQLAKVAHLIGFQIAIQDDRPEWANLERYPQATFIYAQISQALTDLSTYSHLYVALVTRGYRYDLEALTSILNRDLPCDYIGMIGSEQRVWQVLLQAERSGIPTAQLQSIYAPIGLDIGALTPSEIAVSISAELILLRRGGSGRSMSLGMD